MFERKEYILKIQQERSFSKAAESLYISQPSLSAFVKRLEEKIGEPLFDRSKIPIELTECGKEYVRIAEEIMTAEENFLTYLNEHRHCQTGTISIGGSNMNIAYVLAPLLPSFQKAYPGIHINIEEGNISDMQEMLEKGSIDFLVDSCSMDSSSISEYIYRKESLILAVPSDFPCNKGMEKWQLTKEEILNDKHYLAETPAVPLRHMRDTPFISLTPETDTYQRSLEIFKKMDFNPNIILHFSQQSTVYNIICAEMGIGFVSDTLIKNTKVSPKLVYYKLGGEECTRYIKFFKKRSKRMTYAMKAFLGIADTTEGMNDELT